MNINLSGLLAALAPSLVTKAADQLLGTKKGNAAVEALGITPTAVTATTATTLAQPIVDAALDALKPHLENLLDNVIDKYVPAAYQLLARTEINAEVAAFEVKV
jgi:hypothetical protein